MPRHRNLHVDVGLVLYGECMFQSERVVTCIGLHVSGRSRILYESYSTTLASAARCRECRVGDNENGVAGRRYQKPPTGRASPGQQTEQNHSDPAPGRRGNRGSRGSNCFPNKIIGGASLTNCKVTFNGKIVENSPAYEGFDPIRLYTTIPFSKNTYCIV